MSSVNRLILVLYNLIDLHILQLSLFPINLTSNPFPPTYINL